MTAVLLLMTMMTMTMADACQQIPSPQPSYNSWALAQLSLNEPNEVDHFYPHLTDGKPRQRKLESFAPDDGHNWSPPVLCSFLLVDYSSLDLVRSRTHLWPLSRLMALHPSKLWLHPSSSIKTFWSSPSGVRCLSLLWILHLAWNPAYQHSV